VIGLENPRAAALRASKIFTAASTKLRDHANEPQSTGGAGFAGTLPCESKVLEYAVKAALALNRRCRSTASFEPQASYPIPTCPRTTRSPSSIKPIAEKTAGTVEGGRKGKTPTLKTIGSERLTWKKAAKLVHAGSDRLAQPPIAVGLQPRRLWPYRDCSKPDYCAHGRGGANNASEIAGSCLSGVQRRQHAEDALPCDGTSGAARTNIPSA